MSTSGPSKATGAKRGRKAQHYRTSWDEPIEGLARRPSDGRWRVIGTSITYTEPDERLAVDRFKRLYAKNRVRETIAIPFAVAKSGDTQDLRDTLQHHLKAQEPPADPAEAFAHWFAPQPSSTTGESTRIELNGDRLELHGRSVDASAFWPWLRRLILDNRELVAERTGIEWLRWGPTLKQPAESPTLKAVGDLYFDKAPITDHERRKSKLFWQEFCDAVEVRTVREITAERAAVYLDDVLGADNSPTYAKHRFGKIKTILNFARKRGVSPEDIRTALDACAVLVPPKSTSLDPHPISREDFATLLKAADDQGKAILLLALNACLYGKETADLRWADLDLDKGVLVADRGKTGVCRVAVLWPRTVEALKKLPRRIESPFISEAATPYTGETVSKWFRRLRRVAEMRDTVKMADVRDGAYTAAVGGTGVDFAHARILAGHRTAGATDHYLKRHPKLVAEACEAIEKAYF